MQNVMGPEMQNAIGLASIYGPLLLILGIWKLIYHANVNRVVTSMKNTPGAVHAVGLLWLLIGLGVISQYNVWVMGLPFLVTLFGWVSFLRGVFMFFAPQFVYGKTMSNPSHVQFKGLIILAWGFGMSWLAFWM